jgi:hypothetical protein
MQASFERKVRINTNFFIHEGSADLPPAETLLAQKEDSVD